MEEWVMCAETEADWAKIKRREAEKENKRLRASIKSALENLRANNPNWAESGLDEALQGKGDGE